jgi:hypothetical protein
MTVRRAPISDLNANPVAHAELRYLQRTGSSEPTWPRALKLGVYQIALFAALVCFGFGLGVAPGLPHATYSAYRTLAGWLLTPLLLLASFTLFTHFAVVFRALTMAAGSISREKRNGTWENLLLTEVNARQLVLGKWWAVVRATWRDFVLLAALRAGLTVGLGACGYLLLAERVFGFDFFTGAHAPAATRDILLAAGLIALMTLANALFTAAAGIAASLVSLRTASGTMAAQSLRLAAISLPALIILPLAAVTLSQLPVIELGGETAEALKPLILFQFSMADNGTLLGVALANPFDADSATYVQLGLMVLALYTTLTGLLLGLAWFSARRQGVG